MAKDQRAALEELSNDSDAIFSIELRNGIIQVGQPPIDGVTISLSHAQWSDVLLGRTSFGQLDPSLKDFDKALTLQP